MTSQVTPDVGIGGGAANAKYKVKISELGGVLGLTPWEIVFNNTKKLQIGHIRRALFTCHMRIHSGTG